MQYRNHEIEDIIYTEFSQCIETVYRTCDGLDLDTCKIEQLKVKLSDKVNELMNSIRREEGVIFKDFRIRISTYEGDRESYEFPYSEIILVWDESESTEERDKRIEKEKRRIDKEIEQYEKRKAEKKAAQEDRKYKDIADAMEILVKNGYTVTKG